MLYWLEEILRQINFLTNSFLHSLKDITFTFSFYEIEEGTFACPVECPTVCPPDQIKCPGGIGPDGCPMPDTCIPLHGNPTQKYLLAILLWFLNPDYLQVKLDLMVNTAGIVVLLFVERMRSSAREV